MQQLKRVKIYTC